MEPFSMVLGTRITTVSLDDDDMTVVTTTTDTAMPDAAPRVSYEACESDAEASALVQKFAFDLERQGWTMAD